MNLDIPWKQYHISISCSYGKDIEATIHWWSKDYYIEVHSPVKLKLQGKHMMYMVPAKFVLTGEGSSGGHKHIPILEDCKSRLIRHFELGAI